MNEENLKCQKSGDTSSELISIEISLLLEGMFRCYGYDFRHYARSSVERRVLHRMEAEQLTSVSELINGVLHDRAMADRLFQDLSIKVTEMFRNPSFFLSFRSKVVPLLRELPEIRIWHAGCSTGQEPLSMAILLQEEGLLHKSKIYATDMNEIALSKARTCSFPTASLQQYEHNYELAGGKFELKKYCSILARGFHFDPELTKHINFFQHNLVTDQSFNEFHVIICRNVFIYFDEELQRSVHHLFYESLSHGGILGLGCNESLLYADRDHAYKVLDGASKLYRKLS